MGLFTQLRVARRIRNERVTQILDKERCVKAPIFYDLLYVSCIIVMSLVKFSNIVFPV